ncbi:helix-turn-helix domain-containing protein [Streptomyces sp. 8N706]|uniref:helix-turn-helix domain-containing protein n=1 Tax=Streptomyces sp. 8N706 TaxID=3457416 RepID=UPI003FCFBDFA
MNGVTNDQDGSSATTWQDIPYHYRWVIHQVSDSRHQQGPCGTCVTEEGARACIEAALSAAVGPGVYAWGLLSRIPADPPEPASPEPRSPLASSVAGTSAAPAPIAWAAPGPDGTVAWLPHGSRPLVAEQVGGALPAATAASTTGEVTPGKARPGESIPSLLARFGGAVHRYRLAAGLTRQELAGRTLCTAAEVGRIESGRQMPSRVFAQRADQHLGTDGALVHLWPSLIRSAYPDWFWQIIELERQACFIQEFETVAIPGLLQTEAYARSIFTAAHPVASELLIEQFVAARIDRQRILTRREPPQIMITLDEGVLRRCIGGSAAMSEQLGHLLDRSGLPKVHLQVIPFSVREHPGGMTPFRLMGFREGPDVLYGETFIGGQTTIDAGQIQQHKLAFNLIQSKALSRDDSRALIRDLKEDMDRGSE